MDRLTALVALRWTNEWRALRFARERWLSALFAFGGMAFGSLVISFFAYAGLRALAAGSPGSLPMVIGGGASAIGFLWAMSPVLTGIALSESHDMSRLMHFPVERRVLAASSLVANLLQPPALAQAPFLAAVSAALSGSLLVFPLVLLGLGLSVLFAMALAQVVGLALHGLSRSRRFQDLAIFAGLGIGFLVSMLPLLMIAGGIRSFRPLLSVAAFLEWLPFAWGARAAVHAGRGEMLPAAAWAGAACLAILAALLTSAVLIEKIYRGDLDLGAAGGAGRRTARMALPGALGALVEKDLRSAWRDPSLRATLLMSLLGPVFMLLFLSQAQFSGRAGTTVLVLASFVGLQAFGGNALGLERRGLGLLLSFPIARWRVLLAKNMAALLFRLPGLLTLLLAALFTAPLQLAPVAVTIAAGTFAVAAGMDNIFSILFPITAPAPGKNPLAQSSGGRGLGAALMSAAFLIGATLLSAPFTALAWLPLLLKTPLLWLASLPLALAGALAVYAMLVAAAARLLERREPEVLERVLAEA